MRFLKGFFAFVVIGILFTGCAFGPYIILDAWGDKEPDNCYYKVGWEFRNCLNCSNCLAVHGVTFDGEGHSEGWVGSPPSPFGSSHLIYKSAIIYLVGRIDCNTGKEIKTSQYERDRLLASVKLVKGTYRTWHEAGRPRTLDKMLLLRQRMK